MLSKRACGGGGGGGGGNGAPGRPVRDRRTCPAGGGAAPPAESGLSGGRRSPPAGDGRPACAGCGAGGALRGCRGCEWAGQEGPGPPPGGVPGSMHPNNALRPARPSPSIQAASDEKGGGGGGAAGVRLAHYGELLPAVLPAEPPCPLSSFPKDSRNSSETAEFVPPAKAHPPAPFRMSWGRGLPGLGGGWAERVVWGGERSAGRGAHPNLLAGCHVGKHVLRRAQRAAGAGSKGRQRTGALPAGSTRSPSPATAPLATATH